MNDDSAASVVAGGGLAAVLLLTAREVLGVGSGELADAAGCAQELVWRVESGRLDPTMDTVERIVNGSGLELRAGPGSGDGRYGGPDADPQEVARLRLELAEARAFRAELGAPPPGPPGGVLPVWDGEDPAPGRRFGAAEGRRDGGGWAAVIVRSAREEAHSTIERFADACGVAGPALERIEWGARRPSMGELAAMLARFKARRGRYRGVTARLGRVRLAEVGSDDEVPPAGSGTAGAPVWRGSCAWSGARGGARCVGGAGLSGGPRTGGVSGGGSG